MYTNEDFFSKAERQADEIKTIREKKISVNLSESDCREISKLCGEHNLTVGDLLASFIGDLIDGTYSNGSDEVMYARRWFERCWFGMPEKSLLNWILGWQCYRVEDILDLVDNIRDAYEVQNAYKELESNNPEELDGEDVERIGFLEADIADWEKELEEIKSEFLKFCPMADWDEEVEKVKEWYDEMIRLQKE